MSKWVEIRKYIDKKKGKIYLIALETIDDEGEAIVKIDYETKKIKYLNIIAKEDPFAQNVINEVLEDIDNGVYND